MSASLRLLTWNIHGAVGADRRCDHARTLDLIAEMDPDVLVLQEVDGRTHLGRRERAFETFAKALGGHLVEARMFGRQGREHGNLLWSRFPFLSSKVHRLPGGFEPRGLIETAIEAPFGPLRVFGTHLGLGFLARRRQGRACAERMAAGTGPAILCGDLNEWRPAGPVHRVLSVVTPVSHRPSTWPSRRPVIAMDRIYATAGLTIEPLDVPERASRASDHLPVLVRVSTGVRGRSIEED